MTTEPAQALPDGRTQLDLVASQLAAIDAWNRARRASEAAAEAVSLTREMRLDLSRRMEARRREQQALVARADEQMRQSGRLSADPVATRALIAHRNGWLRDNVAKQLQARGVEVVGMFEDGADAAGTVVVEQPDLVLVEDRLPTLSGIELVRRVRTFAPLAVVGAQCLDSSAVRELTEAGAQAVFTRSIPPTEIADQLLACLASAADAAVVA